MPDLRAHHRPAPLPRAPEEAVRHRAGRRRRGRSAPTGEDFARCQPVAFFGATVLAGFALARFAKSSADDARGTGGAHAARGHHAAPGGGGVSAPGTSTAGAPGWVPAPGGRDDAAAETRRPATTAAASLGGVAAHQAGAGQPSPGRSS